MWHVVCGGGSVSDGGNLEYLHLVPVLRCVVVLGECSGSRRKSGYQLLGLQFTLELYTGLTSGLSTVQKQGRRSKMLFSLDMNGFNTEGMEVCVVIRESSYSSIVYFIVGDLDILFYVL